MIRTARIGENMGMMKNLKIRKDEGERSLTKQDRAYLRFLERREAELKKPEEKNPNFPIDFFA